MLTMRAHGSCKAELRDKRVMSDFKTTTSALANSTDDARLRALLNISYYRSRDLGVYVEGSTLCPLPVSVRIKTLEAPPRNPLCVQ